MKKKNKKSLMWIICGVVAVALISLVIVLVLTNNKEKENPKKKDPEQQEKNKKEKKKETNEVEVESKEDEISEEEIVAIYGMSKSDAEELVKKYFTEDGYEFSTRITAAGFYRVTVKDTVNGDVLKFRIDPASKSAIQE